MNFENNNYFKSTAREVHMDLISMSESGLYYFVNELEVVFLVKRENHTKFL